MDSPHHPLTLTDVFSPRGDATSQVLSKLPCGLERDVGLYFAEGKDRVGKRFLFGPAFAYFVTLVGSVASCADAN